MMTNQRDRTADRLSRAALVLAGALMMTALCAAAGCGMSGAQQRAMSRAGHRIEAGRNPDRSLAQAFRLDEFSTNATAVASADGRADRP